MTLYEKTYVLGPEVARGFGRSQPLSIVHRCHSEDKGQSYRLLALPLLKIFPFVPEVGKVVDVMQVQPCTALLQVARLKQYF